LTSAETSASFAPGSSQSITGLPGAAVVVPGAYHRDRLGGTGYEPPDPPDRRDQLRDGVLSGDRVGEDRGIHRTLAAATHDPSFLNNLPHGLVDPMWPLRFRQPSTPVHQRRRIQP